ncbi:MAG: rod shape-determining protein MreD [Candidatus Rokuibacteriota bacterium]
MRLTTYFLAVSGGTLVQSAVAPIVGVMGVVPDVPLVMVIVLALRFGAEVGCLTGFALGLLQDVLIGGPLGLQALSKAIVGFVAGEVPRFCLVSNPAVPVVTATVATVADATLRFAILQLFHYPAAFGELFGRVILPQAAYDGMLTLIIVTAPVLRYRL